MLINKIPKALERKGKPAPKGFRWIIVPYFTHYITKRRVYPKKSRFFRFLVRK